MLSGYNKLHSIKSCGSLIRLIYFGGTGRDTIHDKFGLERGHDIIQSDG